MTEFVMVHSELGFMCCQCFGDSANQKDANKIEHMPGCQIKLIPFCTECFDGGDMYENMMGEWHCRQHPKIKFETREENVKHNE